MFYCLKMRSVASEGFLEDVLNELILFPHQNIVINHFFPVLMDDFS